MIIDLVMRTRCRVVSLLAFIATFAPAVAAVSPVQEVVESDLEEVVVTATRYEQSLFDIPQGVTLVDEAEMLERAPGTPADALRFKPGIWVQNSGNTRGSPVLRGFMGPRLLFMFDGIRRNTAGLFGGPNWFLQNVDALDVNRIEVVRGPGSVLYGSDALGGVINVITNERPVFSPEAQMGGRFYTTYQGASRGTSGRLEVFSSSSQYFGFIGGTLRDINDLRGGDGVGTQDPSRWKERNWDGQFNYQLEDGGEVELFVQDFSRPRSKRFDQPTWNQADDRRLLGLNWRTPELGFMRDVKITAYAQDQESFIDEQFWDSDRDEETVGLELQAAAFPRDDVRVVYGVHFHKDDLKGANPQAGTEDPRTDWSNPALFALSEWQATDRLRLDLGVRWDRFTLSSDAPPFAKVATAIQDAINNGAFALSDLDLDVTDRAITGGLGAVYALTSSLNLVGHVGRAFRAPNKADMLRFGQFTYGFGVPSTDLDPESSLTYEAGLRAQSEDFAGAFTVFHTTIKDALVTSPGTFNGSTWIDANGNGIQDSTESIFKRTNSGGRVVAQGVELEARHYLPRDCYPGFVDEGDLSWYGNFAWVYGKDTGNDEPLDRAFPANGLLGIRWEDDRDPQRRTRWFEFESWMVRRFDRVPSTRATKDPAFFDDPQDKNSSLLRADGGTPGFAMLNARMGFKLSDRTTLTVGLENITNRRYRVKDSRIDGPGRSLLVGLNIRF